MLDSQHPMPTEELNILSSALTSLFTTSQYMDIESLIYLMKELAVLSHKHIVELDPDAGETKVKTQCLFPLSKMIGILKANLHRLSSLWHIASTHVTNIVCTQSNKYLRITGASFLSDVIYDALLALSKPPFSTLPNTDKGKVSLQEMQVPLLEALEDLSSSSYHDVREASLESIYKILSRAGQHLKEGWPLILSLLMSIAAKSDALCIPSAFKSVRFICSDFLSYLPRDAIPLCITTVGKFGRPISDVNIAMAAVQELLWDMADFIAKEAPKIPQLQDTEEGSGNGGGETALWIELFRSLLQLALSPHSDIRNTAIEVLIKAVMTYGNLFSSQTWERTWMEIMFPLLEHVRKKAEAADPTQSDSIPKTESGGSLRMIVHHSRNSEQKRWNKTAVHAIAGAVRIFRSFFPSLLPLEPFPRLSADLLSQIKAYADMESKEVALASLGATKEVLIARSQSSDYPQELWIAAWESLQQIGTSLCGKGKEKVPQRILSAFTENLSELQTKLHEEMTLDDVIHFLDILEPIPLSPVEFVGELSSVQRSIVDLIQKISADGVAIPHIADLLLRYVAVTIGFWEGIKDREKFENDERWKEGDVSRGHVPLAERSIVLFEVLWTEYMKEEEKLASFSRAIDVMGKTMVLKFEMYESNLWALALNAFHKIATTGVPLMMKHKKENKGYHELPPFFTFIRRRF